MKRVIIVTSGFLDCNTRKLSIGGVETYMYQLSLALKEFGYEVCVCQLVRGGRSETVTAEGIECRFVPTSSNQESFDQIYRQYNGADTVFIIGTDQMDIRSRESNVLAIQHGVAFDVPGNMIPGFWGKTRFLQRVSKLLRCLKNVRRMDSVRNTVCVDYNYYNWYKTLGTLADGKRVWVIPNNSSDCISREQLRSKLSASSDVKKIVFARRFYDYRGALLFARVVKRLLDEGARIDVTFAGDGPCREAMEGILAGCQNIHFTSYGSSESVRFHSDFDMAVVPTIFSEGTSLSLCEAMAAGCFPIGTYVGGLSNILIDHYSGLLCAPTEQSLYECIREALEMDSEAFNGMVCHAYETAVQSFSRPLWKERWKKVMESISGALQ